MLRRSVYLSNEFTSKKWYEKVPRLVLGDSGHGFWYHKAWRTRWTRPLRWKTVDSNRFTTQGVKRYGSIIKELDAEKTQAENKIQPEQIRMFDHRRVFWKCGTCGHSFRKSLKGRMQYQAGCQVCKRIAPSVMLGKQSLVAVPKLSATHPQLFAALKGQDAFKKALVAESSALATWTCGHCNGEFSETVRCLTRRQGTVLAKPTCHKCIWNLCAHQLAKSKASPMALLQETS